MNYEIETINIIINKIKELGLPAYDYALKMNYSYAIADLIVGVFALTAFLLILNKALRENLDECGWFLYGTALFVVGCGIPCLFFGILRLCNPEYYALRSLFSMLP